MVEKVYKIDNGDIDTLEQLSNMGYKPERPGFASLTSKYFRLSDEEAQSLVERAGYRSVPETREYVLDKGIPKNELEALRQKLDDSGCKYETKGGWFSTERIVTNDPRAQKILEESGKILVKPMQDYAMIQPPGQKGEKREKQAIA
jgi:hypothetical protein